MWRSWDLNLGVWLQRWLFLTKPHNLSEERSSLLEMDKNPESTLSQRYPPSRELPALLCHCSSQPILRSILCQKYERTIFTVFLLPLSKRATKIFKAVCSDSGAIASIPPSPPLTGCVTWSKSLSVSAFSFLMSRGDTMLKAAF